MPTYSYQCESCQHQFDLFQKITEEPAKICPQCNTPSLKRLIGPGAGFIFKGSGFYITDYRSKEYQEKAKQDSSASTATTSTSTPSTSTPSTSTPTSTSSTPTPSTPAKPVAPTKPAC
jgi:putative FmdB family regulatory protein